MSAPLILLALLVFAYALSIFDAWSTRRSLERMEADVDRLIQVASTTEFRAPMPDDPLVAEFDALEKARLRRECTHPRGPHTHAFAYAYRNPPCLDCGAELEQARWMSCPRCGHQAYYPRGEVPVCGVCSPGKGR